MVGVFCTHYQHPPIRGPEEKALPFPFVSEALWFCVLDTAMPISRHVHPEPHTLRASSTPNSNGIISKQNPKGKSLHRYMFPVKIAMAYWEELLSIQGSLSSRGLLAVSGDIFGGVFMIFEYEGRKECRSVT